MNEVEKLRNDNLVREKDLGNGISSFNFSNKCFWDKAWNDETIKARGLFIDVNNNKVVARSYNKFFNLGERQETQLDSLHNSFTYPVSAYLKYNGFLALISADKNDRNKLFIASKSTNQGNFAGYIITILNEIMPAFDQKNLANFLAEKNATAVFECIDPVHDPHIVHYYESDLILLDIIYNQYEYKHINYNDMKQVADTFNLHYKKLVKIIYSWDEFNEFINNHKTDYAMEGFVFEDAQGQMVKYKCNWYRNWKQVRGVLQQVWNGRDIKTIKNIKDKLSFCSELTQYIPKYVKHIKDIGETSCPSVIEMRENFYADTL